MRSVKIHSSRNATSHKLKNTRAHSSDALWAENRLLMFEAMVLTFISLTISAARYALERASPVYSEWPRNPQAGRNKRYGNRSHSAFGLRYEVLRIAATLPPNTARAQADSCDELSTTCLSVSSSWVTAAP